MIFKRTEKVMAVKRIRSTVDEKEQKQLLMDLEVVMKSNDCIYIVQFYGALFKEGDCWIVSIAEIFSSINLISMNFSVWN